MKRRILNILFLSSIVFFYHTCLSASQEIITEVEINTLYRIPKEKAFYFLSPLIGKPYKEEEIESSVKDIKMLDIFKDIVVRKSVSPKGGIKVSYDLSIKEIVSRVKIKGNSAIEKAQILQALALVKGKEFLEKDLEKGVGNLKELYRKEGFFKVEISTEKEIDKTTNEVSLTVLIKEGIRSVITDIEIEIEKKESLDQAFLDARFKPLRGSPYQEKKLEELSGEIEKQLVRKGYLKVDIKHKTSLKDGKLWIIFNINLGDRVDIQIIGANQIDKKDIEERLTIFDYRSVDDFEASESASRIISLYSERGYPFAEVSHEVKRNKDESAVEGLIFTIKEGHKVIIKDIDVSGNHFFNKKELLKILELPKSGPSKELIYNEAMIQKDLDTITNLYRQMGFSDISVKRMVSFDEKNELTTIQIYVEEGIRKKVKGVLFQGNSVFSQRALLKIVKLKRGTYFNPETYENDKKQIASFYSNKGYINTEVTGHIKPEEKGEGIYIEYTISEGSLVLFGRTFIKGSLRTTDSLIRNALRYKEGMPFSYEKLVSTYSELQSLQIFDNIGIAPVGVEEKKERIDIILDLEEGDRGSANFGVGYNSREEYQAFAEIEEKNIFGKGHKASINLRITALEKKYDLNYKIPYLIPRYGLSGSSNLSRGLFNFLDLRGYDLLQRSFSVSLSKSFTKSLRSSLSLRFEDSDIENFHLEDKELTKENKFTTHNLALSLFYDKRDNFLNPKRGIYGFLNLEYYGGILGGDASFYSIKSELSFYYPILNEVILAASVRHGFEKGFEKTDNVPLYKHLYAGGMNTVRGYKEDNLGPRDSKDNPLGGETMLITNLEVRYPIYKKLGGVIFWDRGNVWEKASDISLGNMKNSVGTGLRINTPVGPVRIDYGYKLNRRTAESRDRFHFSLGHTF